MSMCRTSTETARAVGGRTWETSLGLQRGLRPFLGDVAGVGPVRGSRVARGRLRGWSRQWVDSVLALRWRR